MSPYTPKDWANGPEGGTPILDTDLEHLETQYAAAMADVATDISNPASPIGAALATTAGGIPKAFAVTQGIAALGDSRTASMASMLPASTYFTNDWLPMAVGMAGGGWKIVYNGGVSGDTTAQIAARVPNVIASGATACVVFAGINDGWTTTAGVDASFVTRRQITDQLIAAGIYVFSFSEIPDGLGTTAKNDLCVYFNRQEEAYWRGKRTGEFVALWPATADPATGLADATCYYDTPPRHPNGKGAWNIAKLFAPRLASRAPGVYRQLPASMRDYYLTNNNVPQYLPNPLMQGTGGVIGAGNSGTLPTGATIAGVAVSAFSTPPRADRAGNDLRIAVAAGASGQYIRVLMPVSAPAVLAVGTKWVITADCAIESCVDLRQFRIGLDTSKFALYAGTVVNAVTAQTLATETRFVYTSPEFTVTAAVELPTYARLDIALDGKTSSPWSATVRVGRAGLFRIS